MDDAPLFPVEPPPFAIQVERRDRAGLPRIRDMRVAELAYRGWQEATKWLERVSPSDATEHPIALLVRHAPDLADPGAALSVLRDRAPARFFPGVADAATAPMLAARMPEDFNELVAQAEGFIQGRFDLLGYGSLWFGEPVDWHFDPLRVRRAPLEPWRHIDPHDVATVGDSRLLWELNRHQWLVRLAQAWACTGDDRYARAATDTIDAWSAANPPGYGINWVSSAEVGLRLISWCWTMVLLRQAPAVSAEWVQRALAGVWLHATHVKRNLSSYCARNTDLTTGALALLYAGTVFPEFLHAQEWRAGAMRILASESESQVCMDGVHYERSTCYHRYTLDTYLHFLLLAQRNWLTAPEHVPPRVRHMVEFMLAIRQPDGSLPVIGDDDGGGLLPLGGRPDARASFAVAAALFDRADFAWAAGRLTSDVLWLLGPSGVRAFDALRPEPPAHSPSRVFPSGGYASMRGGWEPDAHHAIVDIGPIGCPVSGGHGHADLLSIQCSIFGEPCLVDAGTFCYTADSGWRDFFRSTAAHSTVIVDGASQAQPAGSFGWRRQPRVRLREWHSTPEFDFLDAEHDGYTALPEPVVHRRRVVFVKPGYWILVDDLSGAGRHQIDLTFQFAPLAVTLDAHPWARAETRGGHVLWICPFPVAPVQPALKYGELSPMRGWISREYGHREPAPMLIYSFAVALPWRMLTLLLPDRRLATPPAVRAIYDESGRPEGVAFERPRRVVRVDERAVSVERD